MAYTFIHLWQLLITTRTNNIICSHQKEKINIIFKFILDDNTFYIFIYMKQYGISFPY